MRLFEPLHRGECLCGYGHWVSTGLPVAIEVSWFHNIIPGYEAVVFDEEHVAYA